MSYRAQLWIFSFFCSFLEEMNRRRDREYFHCCCTKYQTCFCQIKPGWSPIQSQQFSFQWCSWIKTQRQINKLTLRKWAHLALPQADTMTPVTSPCKLNTSSFPFVQLVLPWLDDLMYNIIVLPWKMTLRITLLTYPRYLIDTGYHARHFKASWTALSWTPATSKW